MPLAVKSSLVADTGTKKNMELKPKKKQAKRTNLAIFVLPQDLRDKIRREAYHTRRSMSDVVREALFVYFVNK